MSLAVPDDLSPTIDAEEVRRALAVLIPPGKTFEIRALPSGRSWVGRDIGKAIEAVAALAGGTGCYYTLNPVRTDLSGAAKNRDITGRSRLLIDVDSVRPDRDIPATDEEKRAARALGDLLMLHMRSLGCPEPIVIDSGNGYQLVYAIDLPNSSLASKWVQTALRHLASLYDSEGARVDVAVHNAGRIARLPGTWNRKGPASPDRPHRMARLVSVPSSLDPIPEDALSKLASLKAEPEPVSPRLAAWTVPDLTNGDAGAWFKRALEGEITKALTAPDGTRHDALRAAARTLAGSIHHGYLTEAEIVSALTAAGRGSGLPEKETREAIAWGVEDGKATPLSWPDRLQNPRAARGPTPDGGKANATEGKSGRKYAFPLVVKGSSVTPRKVHWLWPDRIPYGFLTLMAGRTGVGKSFVTLDLAARLTVGEEIPLHAGECFEPSSCLIISEDSHDYILSPRLIEAGADMDRVNFMSWEAMASFTLADTQMLDDTFVEAGCPKLVVIDPPTNFLGARDEHKNAEVRSVLMYVSIWAMRHDVACVLITHCNKGVKKDMAALDRIIGSVAWASTSRIAHIFAPNPDERNQGVFIPLKSNIGRMPEGLTYEIETTETLARVKWLDKIDFDADDALSGEKKKPRGVAAVEWLAERFRERREWPADELKREAAEAGVSKNALWSAEALALPILKRRRVNAEGEVHWYWHADAGWPPEN